jgi:putative protease
MNTLNSEAVKFWQKNGVKRIILGRETTLADIKKIHQAVPKMELEMFVHGAMCLSYSGRCYLSAEMSGRSANEGLCTQPCRFEYKLYAEEKMRPGELMPIEEDGKNMYIFNSRDLCLIDYLSELIKAGVISFKIEGRTKSAYYVSTVSRAYRQVLDNLGNKKVLNEARQELIKIDHRGYTTGFLLGSERGSQRQDLTTSKLQSEWQFVGEVYPVKSGESGKPKAIFNGVVIKEKEKNQVAVIFFRPHNVLKVGEELELLTPDNCYKIKVKEFFDASGKKLTEVHGGTDKIYHFSMSADIQADWGLLRKKIK